jgi:hypothetical protein
VTDQSLSETRQTGKRRTWASRLFFIFGLGAAAFLAVSHEGTSSAGEPAAIDGSRFTGDHFVATLTGSGRYNATRPSTATFTIKPTAPFTVDRNHPWTLTLHNPPGYKVALTKNVFKKDDLNVAADGSSATFTVPFIPTAVGRGTIDGQMNLRVCSAEKEKGKGETCETRAVHLTMSFDIEAAPSPPPDTDKKAPKKK